MKSPTMIIGIGGVGSEICAMISKMLPKDAPDNEYIKFAAVDTDVNAMRELRRNGFRGVICQISQNMTVDKYLRDEVDGDKEEKWYPDSPLFRRKPLTEGAGQMRAIARLALDDAIRSGRIKPLLSEIDGLFGLIGAKDQALRVYLIGSLEGGTGSGISLYLPMYLEYHYRKKFGDYRTLINGYFLLPSVMEAIIRKAGERASIAANAYAALKEMGAFMNYADSGSKQDGNAPVMYLADLGAREYIEYDHSPFEYVYLYEALDRNGNVTKAYTEIKEVVAKTVYVQACSSMQGKNNSLEDNVKKILIAQMNEEEEVTIRRFGGAGCTELIYPYELLKEYYALRWAREVMSNQWKKYDRIFEDKARKYLADKKKGMRVTPVFRSQEYMEAIENAERTDILAEGVRNSCCRENGLGIWNDYLDNMEKEIEDSFDNEWNRLAGEIAYNDLEINIDILKGKDSKESKKKNAKMVDDNYKQVKKLVETIPEASAPYLADYLFKLHPAMEGRSNWEMESVLTVNQEFVHPNAVRFFLYKLKDVMEKRQQQLLKRVEDEAEKYESDKFSVKKDRFNKDLVSIGKMYEEALKGLREGTLARLKLECLKSGLVYVNNLITQYQSFYDKYEDMTEEFYDRIREIEAMLKEGDNKNRAVNYVCANRLCREKEWEWMEKNAGFLHIESGLSMKIFGLMHEDWEEETVKKNNFLQLKEYWIETWEKEFGSHFDNNILAALKQEAGYENPNQVFPDCIIAKLDTALNDWAAARAKNNKSEVPHEMQICCYNKELKNLQGGYESILRWIIEHNGVEEEKYCSRYQMIFYSSFLGIDYYQVQEFDHDEGKKTQTGYYYDDYQNAIDSIQMINGNPVSTPHIDKHWHNCSILHDSDKHLQRKQEERVQRAFLLGIINGKFRQSNQKFFYEEAAETKFETMFSLYQALYENPLWVRKLNLLDIKKAGNDLFLRFGDFYLELIEKDRAVFELKWILDICKALYKDKLKENKKEGLEEAAVRALKVDYDAFKSRYEKSGKLDAGTWAWLDSYFA